MSDGDSDVANGCTVRSRRHAFRSIPHFRSTESENRRCPRHGKWPCRHESSIAVAPPTARISGTSATFSWSKIASTSAVVIPGS